MRAFDVGLLFVSHLAIVSDEFDMLGVVLVAYWPSADTTVADGDVVGSGFVGGLGSFSGCFGLGLWLI